MTATEQITIGASRLLVDMGFAPLTELSLTNNRRVDIVGLSKSGRLVIVEVKSGLADFRTDQKWHEYLPYCEEFYFAVDENFPLEVFDEDTSLPDETGIIIADKFGGEVIRTPLKRKVNAKRAKTLIEKMARTGALRLFQPVNYKETL